jgi:hypothetical protein
MLEQLLEEIFDEKCQKLDLNINFSSLNSVLVGNEPFDNL